MKTITILILSIITLTICINAQSQSTNLILVEQTYLSQLQEKSKELDNLKAQSINPVNIAPNPSVTSSTLIVRKAKIRTFLKKCPECNESCISTNLIWNGGSNAEKWGSVMFKCNHDDCNNIFSEEIKQPIKHSEPMTEITDSITK